MGKTSFDEIDQKSGEFKRQPTTFRNFIEKDGKFPPQKDRYHLYVSLACPWASRCLAVRVLKGLEDVIQVHCVKPRWGVVNEETGNKSWVFGEKGEKFAGVPVDDPLYGCKSMRELYLIADKNYDDKYTVPVLWDAEQKTIVNNESSEIIRMFDSAFDEFCTKPELKLAPKDKQDAIDAINEKFYNTVNNGVYRAGFATTQEAYEKAFNELFETLDYLEARLDKSRYLLGPNEPLSEADIRLFVTTIRFDAVYVTHFKCNKRLLQSYPNLSAWTQDVYQTGRIGELTVNMEHIKNHYFGSHPDINKYGIVPLGFDLPDFNGKHGRDERKY